MARHLTTLFVWGVVLVLGLWFLDVVRWILLGLLAAACVAAAMRPLMRFVPGPQWLRGVMVGLVPIVVAGGMLTLVLMLLASPIRREMRHWPRIRDQLNNLLAGWSERLGLDDPMTVEQAVAYFRGFIADQPVLSTTTSIVTTLGIALAFTFFGAIFILIEQEQRFMRPLLEMLPRRRRSQFLGAINDLEPGLRWWLIGALISTTTVGVLSWVGFRIVGLEFALPLAMLVGMAEIVPTVGPAAAFLVAVLFGLTQSAGTAVGVAAVYLVIQTIESYVLYPVVMRRAVKLPPLVTLFTVVLWGMVFGPAGLFLAIPLDLLVWAFADRFVRQRDEPLAEPAIAGAAASPAGPSSPDPPAAPGGSDPSAPGG